MSLLTETLGEVKIDSGMNFQSLGGDSLAAVRLTQLFKEKLRVDVPIGTDSFYYFDYMDRIAIPEIIFRVKPLQLCGKVNF
jgi:hypothetical protein